MESGTNMLREGQDLEKWNDMGRYEMLKQDKIMQGKLKWQNTKEEL